MREQRGSAGGKSGRKWRARPLNRMNSCRRSAFESMESGTDRDRVGVTGETEAACYSASA